ITIRDQWVERLVQHFLPEGEPHPTWVSTELKNPAFLTVATYQAVHSLCSGEVESEAPSKSETEEPDFDRANHEGNGNGGSKSAETFPEVLSQAGFKTLVVDEAHHLRSEWWKTLTFVANHLDHPVIVALTATPPYDVSPFEWQRYEDLCGPVDA